MKPIIGINMSYSEYGGENQGEVGSRDFYKIYISYVDSVENFGGIALLVPCLRKLLSLDNYIDIADGFIFTGGDDYPAEFYNEEKHPKTKLVHRRRADADIYLVEKVLQSNKPVLAICGGIQLVNIARGGKLIQHLDHLEMHNKKSEAVDRTHIINIKKNSCLYDIFKKEEIFVNSAHHQAVDPENIGKGLRVAATAPDGVIEALEFDNSDSRFFINVQWHPERMMVGKQRELIFNAFISAAKAFSS